MTAFVACALLDDVGLPAERNHPMRSSFVYIMTNAKETLYIGVTSNIERRVD